MMKRQPLIVANWKMNGSLRTTQSLLAAIRQGLDDKKGAAVAICPPFPYLQEAANCIKESQIMLGAQDLSAYTNGAYTGDVAGHMLRDYQCELVIIGHSERRKYNAETDEQVAEKYCCAIQAGLIPIVCVGESLAERDAGNTKAVIARQLDAVLQKSTIAALETAIIAYEPIWAIGTGNAATPLQAQEVHAFIRLQLARCDDKIANTARILYGGSVTAANAAALFEMADIDGGLIGGASLIADEFLTICRAIQ